MSCSTPDSEMGDGMEIVEYSTGSEWRLVYFGIIAMTLELMFSNNNCNINMACVDVGLG